MDAPKNCLPLKDAPRDGRYLLLVGDSGYTGIKYRAIVARYVKEYASFKGSQNCDLEELDRRCWRDHSNDHVTDSGEMPEYFMFLPWEYDNDDVNAIVLEVLKAVMADNENIPNVQYITASEQLFRLVALVFGLTQTKIMPSTKPIVECPDCAAIVSIDIAPKGSTFEDTAICPQCGKYNFVDKFRPVMPLPNQNQAPQQARTKEASPLEALKYRIEKELVINSDRTPEYYAALDEVLGMIEESSKAHD